MSSVAHASSDWATGLFCSNYGPGLWHRLTQKIHIDRKPEGYAFAGDTEKLTADEIKAIFADPAPSASPKE